MEESRIERSARETVANDRIKVSMKIGGVPIGTSWLRSRFSFYEIDSASPRMRNSLQRTTRAIVLCDISENFHDLQAPLSERNFGQREMADRQIHIRRCYHHYRHVSTRSCRSREALPSTSALSRMLFQHAVPITRVLRRTTYPLMTILYDTWIFSKSSSCSFNDWLIAISLLATHSRSLMIQKWLIVASDQRSQVNRTLCHSVAPRLIDFLAKSARR